MTDLQIIQLLEREIGFPLKSVGAKDLWKEQTYTLNEHQRIIGINLNSCELKKIPPRLLHLKYLQSLSLSENRIAVLDNRLADFRRLQELVIDQNDLRKFPLSITKLKRLRKLSLVNNDLKDLPIEIRELKNLEVLGLSKNKITVLPKDFGQLQNLSHIYLNDNFIKEWSADLQKFRRLKMLDLRNNRIVNLPTDSLKLNMVFKWERAISLEGIFLEGNPLEKPPVEILKKGDKAIRSYLASLKGRSRPLNEVKVLLVGDGGAGKTSLMKRLRGKGFNRNEAQTHGINIATHTLPIKHESLDDIKVHYWDFGGQEIMHASHQFFLSKRSLYILVLDSRKDAKTEYWLKHIESFGGKSPIIIVLNKVDENPAFEVNRKFLQEKYSTIVGFFRISCSNNRGMDELRESVENAIFQLPHLQTPWSIDWFAVKNQLENTNKNYISYDDYLSLCSKHRITDKDAQNTLLEYLNDLGIMLHFGDDINLRQTSVLNPKWVTQAVYKIINAKELADQHGILQLEHLDHILKPNRAGDYKYPHATHHYIIRLMSRFKLCYQLNEHSVLIPDLLDVEEVRYNFQDKNLLKFMFQYDFFTKSIMPRFIVDMHDDIKERRGQRLLWRTGVVLENKQCKAIALVKADEEAKRINIYVGGEQRRDYFAVIRHILVKIHDSFEKMTVNELIPLPNHENYTVDYEEIMGYEKANRDIYFAGKIGKEFSVKQLLDGIERAEERQKKHTTIAEPITVPTIAADASDTTTISKPVSEVEVYDKWYQKGGLIRVLVIASLVLTLLASIAGFLADSTDFWDRILKK